MGDFSAKESDEAAKDFHMDAATREAWPLFSSASPEEFYRDMTSGLPEGTQLRLTLKPSGDAYISYKYTTAYGDNDERQARFSFERQIKDGHADNVEAFVDKHLRNKGISKTVNRNIFRLYQEMDIKSIGTSAEEMGAYVQARLGFVPKPEDWREIKDEIGRRLDFIEAHPSEKDGPLPHDYVEGLRKVLASDDPKGLWSIVDQSRSYYGTSMGELLTFPLKELPEEFPLGEARKYGLQKWLEWNGSLDMTDRACVDRYKAYLHVGQNGSPSPRQKSSPAPSGTLR